jgi:pimeloyl-ACP methyl ester carboxylesterase
VAHLPSGIDICYQTFGRPDDEPLLLIMGLGGPMLWWDDAWCTGLAKAGFFVIRYDNRDTGHSTRIRARVTRTMLVRAYFGRATDAPYTLRDMAHDGLGLLDHLGIESAHLVGISMGGMIAQTLALMDPSRTLTLTSIMSNTGRRRVGWADPKLFPRLLQPPANTQDEYVESNLAFWKLIGSPGFQADEQAVRARAQETWDRGVNPAGALRQMVAILGSPDRTPALRKLRVPTLVIHGLSDRMVHVSGGRATAHAVPGAELLLVPGMGHDLPSDLYPQFVDAIRALADRARVSR